MIPSVGQEPLHVLGLVGRDLVDIEAIEGGEERLALFQDGQPRQPGLVDLQHQPLEQNRVVMRRKAIFRIMVGPVNSCAGATAQ